MTAFNLKIITSTGIKYDGPAECIMVRSVVGDVSILAKHADYVTAIGIGKAVITKDGNKRIAAANGGVLNVSKGEVTVLASTFEWQDEIDLNRAHQSLERSKGIIENTHSDDKSIELAKLAIVRALIRINVKNEK